MAFCDRIDFVIFVPKIIIYENVNQKEYMIKVLQLSGTEDELYRLVGPLVMNPKVLRQNLNFPFRTTENFIWFLAEEEGQVLGFMPVERKRIEMVINNYYVQNKNREILSLLLKKVINVLGKQGDLASVTFVEDAELFAQFGFKEEKKWTRYLRMKRTKEDAKV